RSRDRGLRVLVPPGLAAERRATHRPARPHGFRRPRTDGALLSGSARRHPRWTAAEAETHLPHVQRLHHRPAARARLGLLSARRLLQIPRTGRYAQPAEVSRRSLTTAEWRMPDFRRWRIGKWRPVTAKVALLYR